MKKITVRQDEIVRKIKDLNGVGGGPVSVNFSHDATELFREAKIPYSRTHDIEYPFGSGEYVDIHCIFPRFDDDPDDPKSYNFVFTDEYLKAIVNAGTKPFYRLGTSIEHQPVKRYIYPPKDYEKWGKICSHIIAHYNEGWADGFEMGIEYWEIWNEPDLTNKCWIGTDEEFFRLYDVASKIIKSDHPNIKIGGCGFTSSKVEMVDHFLAFIRKSGAPLDFLSWHAYIHTPQMPIELSKAADEVLKKHGFDHAESIYDEWNYLVRWDSTVQKSLDLHNSMLAASLCSSVMTVLQKSRTDKAMYYDAQCVMPDWNGLFRGTEINSFCTSYKIVPLKAYYALKAWSMLKDLNNEIYSESNDRDVYVVAAADEKTIRILVTYYNDDAGFGDSKPNRDSIDIDLGDCCLNHADIRIVDDTHDFEPEPLTGNTISLDGNSFALITITR